MNILYPFTSNIYVSTLKNIYAVLLPHQRKKSLGIFLLVAVNGLIEVLGLAFVLPVLYIINDPSIIFSNEYLSYCYNYFSFSSTNNFSITLMLLLLVVFIIKNGTSSLIVYLQYKFANSIAVELISSQYKKYLAKDYLYFKSTNSNYIIRDIATIPSDFAQGVLMSTINFSTELVIALFVIIGISMYNLTVFFLLSIIMLPSFLLFYNLIKKKVDRYGQEVNDVRSGTFKTMFEAIFGIDEVKLANKEEFFIKRSMSPLRYYFGLIVRLNVFKMLPTKVIEVVAILGIVLIFFYSVSSGKNTEYLFSLLIIFATAAYRLMPSLNRMISSLIEIKNKNYVFDILKDISGSDAQQKVENDDFRFEKHILLKDIEYQFADKEVAAIDQLSLIVNKGEKVGLVGESGSGKSTFIKLFIGLLQPKAGTVLIDGVEVNLFESKKWRRKIGYVQQDFYLLDSSLAENIAFGERLEDIDYDKLNHCIQLSKLESVVDNLPKRELTKVGEFGGELSGGQRQRIAIARALYKDAEILIFDEATSALDNDTETEIIDTINNLNDRQYTIIMIAHRISSLKFCDTIYKMKEGSVVGKYDNYKDVE